MTAAHSSLFLSIQENYLSAPVAVSAPSSRLVICCLRLYILFKLSYEFEPIWPVSLDFSFRQCISILFPDYSRLILYKLIRTHTEHQPFLPIWLQHHRGTQAAQSISSHEGADLLYVHHVYVQACSCYMCGIVHILPSISYVYLGYLKPYPIDGTTKPIHPCPWSSFQVEL